MDDTTRAVLDLLRRGNKIEAVKALRKAKGLDLKQAVEEVERLAAGEPPSPSATERTLDDGAVSDEVRRLATSGRKIDAVKLLRFETGISLKEARGRIDRIAGSRRSGCLGSVALVAGASAALTLLLP